MPQPCLVDLAYGAEKTSKPAWIIENALVCWDVVGFELGAHDVEELAIVAVALAVIARRSWVVPGAIWVGRNEAV